MIIKDFTAWMQRDQARFPIILLHGSDAGLIHERAAAIAGKAVDDPGDPFRLVRLAGDDLSSDPLRLADEANTISMFGGSRVIWVTAGSRPIITAVTPIISTPPQDAVVVIEAGDLKKTAPLRTLCEKSPHVASIACYADESKTLHDLAADIIRRAGLTIDAAAMRSLIAALGADRAASRAEIEKLVLYCHGHTTITEADIGAVLSDVATLDSAILVDAAYLGDFSGVEQQTARLFSEGLDPGILLGALLRHAIILKKMLQTELRGDIGQAATMQGVYFKRHGALERQLKSWRTDLADRAIQQTGDAAALVRKTPTLGEAIAVRTLWMIALAAKRR